MNNPYFYSNDKDELSRLFPYVREYQKLALKHKIADIFQDNGGKYLELQIILGLTTTGKREGNDATDADGNEYEIKTVNLDLQKQFTTHHHLNHNIIAKYRRVSWYFAVYRGIELQVIYLMTPDMMEPHYRKWEAMLSDGRKDINNPKIPLKDIVRDGIVAHVPKGMPRFTFPGRGTVAGTQPEIEFEVGEEG